MLAFHLLSATPVTSVQGLGPTGGQVSAVDTLSHQLKEQRNQSSVFRAMSQGIDPSPETPAQPGISGDRTHLLSLPPALVLVTCKRFQRIRKFWTNSAYLLVSL